MFNEDIGYIGSGVDLAARNSHNSKAKWPKQFNWIVVLGLIGAALAAAPEPKRAPIDPVASLIKDVRHQASDHMRQGDGSVTLSDGVLTIKSWESHYGPKEDFFMLTGAIPSDMRYVRKALDSSSVPVQKIIFDVELRFEDKFGNPKSMDFVKLSWDAGEVKQINPNAQAQVYLGLMQLEEVEMGMHPLVDVFCSGKYANMAPMICGKR